MKYLISYNEKLDRDIYKSFIDRYRKTDYISKSNIKRMHKMGISFEVFKKLEKDINKYITFFKKNNIGLLREILQYAEDDSPVIVKPRYIWYSINSKSEPRSYFSLDIVNTIVSEDDNGLPSRDHKKLSNPINILNHIIEATDVVRSSTITSWEKRKESDLGKRPGYIDPFITTGLRGIKNADLYEVIKISPQISIDFEFGFKQVSDENDDDHYMYNGRNYISRRNEVNKFKQLLESDDIISRYFRAIGYPDIKFRIYEKFDQVSNLVLFEIKIDF